MKSHMGVAQNVKGWGYAGFGLVSMYQGAILGPQPVRSMGLCRFMLGLQIFALGCLLIAGPNKELFM